MEGLRNSEVRGHDYAAPHRSKAVLRVFIQFKVRDKAVKIQYRYRIDRQNAKIQKTRNYGQNTRSHSRNTGILLTMKTNWQQLEGGPGFYSQQLRHIMEVILDGKSTKDGNRPK